MGLGVSRLGGVGGPCRVGWVKVKWVVHSKCGLGVVCHDGWVLVGWDGMTKLSRNIGGRHADMLLFHFKGIVDVILCVSFKLLIFQLNNTINVYIG